MNKQEIDAMSALLKSAEKMPMLSVYLVPPAPTRLDRLLLRLPNWLRPQSVVDKVTQWDQFKAAQRNLLGSHSGETFRIRRSLPEG